MDGYDVVVVVRFGGFALLLIVGWVYGWREVDDGDVGVGVGHCWRIEVVKF